MDPGFRPVLPRSNASGVPVIIAGTNYNARPWPTSSIRPAIDWMQDAANYWNGYDWGAGQDAYETTALFQGTETVINALEQSLHVSREQVAISGIGFPLFAPNVDHTGTINTVAQGIDRSQVQWGTPDQVYQLEVRFRAIAPALLSLTPSLASLRLQDGFQASSSFESLKAFTYNQAAVYEDHRSDSGTFVGTFSQSTAELQAILAYLLTASRAVPVAFPSSVSAVVPYPFGRTRGTPGDCVIRSFEYSRKNLNRWNLKIQFHEAP